ncbi:AraC family transcriptional regulator [Mucilaginibacter sp.]|uniref:helix-turn-helix domain-containing protein n=1 Tax=Mucilaginibacter sp. TaxID=1882438 RepID=UPI0025D6314F|nr:AraC family transcriptional regulator [Mucilaginibacter sp.]
MEYLKILKNNNIIYSGTRNHKCPQQQTADFTMRFVFSGNENYSIGRRNLTIYPDSFLVLNKGTQYSSIIDCPFPVHAFSISFDKEFIDGFINNDEPLEPFYGNSQDFEFNETIYPLKGDMFFNVKQLKYQLDNGMDDESVINEYLGQCLISYFKIYNEEISQKTGQLNFFHESTRVEILRRLNRAKEYLYTNYNRNIGLDELAEYSCLSVNHLLRTFKQAFNLTPHQFLIQLRLQRAQVLLRNTNYPVGEVVNLIGFECPSSFIRLFREHFQTTPLKYRQTA